MIKGNKLITLIKSDQICISDLSWFIMIHKLQKTYNHNQFEHNVLET